LLRMLPVRDPASLFRTVRASGNAYDSGGGGSYILYREMQKRTSRFAELMAYQAADPAVISIDRSEPERLVQQTVSGNYFRVLGVDPIAGRIISPEDDREPGQHPVAVISYRLWQTRFDKSERAIGNKLQFRDRTFDIIGVAPAAFFGVEVGKTVDVWTPVSMAPADNLRNSNMFWLRIMGRLRPGVTIAQAAAPMQAVVNETMLEDVRQHAPPGTPKQVIDSGGNADQRSAGRWRNLVPATPIPAAAPDHDVRCRAGTADRVFKCRESTNSQRKRKAARDSDSSFARRRKRPNPAAALYREPSACPGSRRCGSLVSTLGDADLSPATYSVR
jgi:hypothetical protein